jgi:hypothetical protein
MKRTSLGFTASTIGWMLLLGGSISVSGQTAPNLGVAGRFGVLASSGVTGSTGSGTIVNCDVGSSPTASVSNFPPSTVTPPFVLHTTNDLIVQQARADAILAYAALLAQGTGTALGPQLDAVILIPGIYSFTSTADLASGGTLTFNGPGVYILQVETSLTTNTLSNMAFIGGASPCDVYWRVGASATLNGLTFGGVVLADESITVGSGSNVSGRLLAGTGPAPADPIGAVTMAGAGGNTIGGCIAPPVCPETIISPATLPLGQVGTPYNAIVTATGDAAPYTFVVTAGALPAGLTLNSTTGAITGTPTAPAPANFTITAFGIRLCSASRVYSNPISGRDAGIPALDYVGLGVLAAILAAAGVFVTSRLSS